MRRKTLSIGIIVVALTALVPVRSVQAAQASQTFGNTTAGSLTDSGDSNYLNGSRFVTGSTGGTLTSMSVYVAAIDAAPNNKYQLAIYADSGNTPGTLIAKSATGTLAAYNWNTLPITATITANTNYWLMYNTNGSGLNQNNMRYAGGGTGGYTSSGAAFGTMPSPFGAFTANALSFSIYGTYTPTSGSTPPTVAITAPAAGSVISGLQTVAASASDAGGVAGVQFKLDGANLGAEDTTTPYSVAWDTTTTSNAAHALTAVARNVRNVRTTSAAVTVNVSNAPVVPSGVTGTALSSTQVSVGWTASSSAASYNVYRNGALVGSPSSTGFQDAGLTANTSYSYTVSAVNAFGLESARSAPAVVTTPARTSGGTVLFDDFLGTSIDSTKWDVYDRISDQSNGEVNCVIPANVSIAGGVLNGTSKHEDHSCGDSQQAPVVEHYTSWQIAQKAAPFEYGTVEVRAKEPGGTGIWPTIFLLGYRWQPSQAATANTPGANWPVGGWSEIDIAEFLANARTQVNNVVHFQTSGGTVQAPLPYSATSRFMVYRLQWSANALIWSVDAEDGAGYRTLRTITDPAKIPNVPMYLTINAAIGGIGGGTPNPTTFPQTFQVDWVRISQ